MRSLADYFNEHDLFSVDYGAAQDGGGDRQGQKARGYMCVPVVGVERDSWQAELFCGPGKTTHRVKGAFQAWLGPSWPLTGRFANS